MQTLLCLFSPDASLIFIKSSITLTSQKVQNTYAGLSTRHLLCLQPTKTEETHIEGAQLPRTEGQIYQTPLDPIQRARSQIVIHHTSSGVVWSGLQLPSEPCCTQTYLLQVSWSRDLHEGWNQSLGPEVRHTFSLPADATFLMAWKRSVCAFTSLNGRLHLV